eukprot:TRINITY_DN20961_c0_g1_i1.p1 TRINITY_DN20961_c0_g1~~TRINITY_DN20961_c0_g1_i1.p1  ORF type:complete len:208 (+),score=32.97 TRINITY_DN20961_c0_g1_i1:49-624(+)
MSGNSSGGGGSGSSDSGGIGTLHQSEEADKEVDEAPQPGVVLKLAEVSGCELDMCCAALMHCDGNFHAALAKLRTSQGAEEAGSAYKLATSSSPQQLRAALQMLDQARLGRSVTQGALGSAWIVAALLLHAFEYILPKRFLELLLALLGIRADGPLGLIALLLPLFTVLLMVIVARPCLSAARWSTGRSRW